MVRLYCNSSTLIGRILGQVVTSSVVFLINRRHMVCVCVCVCVCVLCLCMLVRGTEAGAKSTTQRVPSREAVRACGTPQSLQQAHIARRFPITPNKNPSQLTKKKWQPNLNCRDVLVSSRAKVQSTTRDRGKIKSANYAVLRFPPICCQRASNSP